MELEWEWVQCDKCQKWRGLKLEDFNNAVQKETWYCFQNPDMTQASCDIPQVLTDSEIDAIYRKREMARARKLVPPVIWQEIEGNVYTYKRRKSWKEDDIAICQCRSVGGQGCLENCINRMLNIECTNGFCPCGSACTNQRFARRQHAPVEIRRAGMKGFGLFSTALIHEGDFVTEYMGEIVDETEYLRRRTFYAENGHKHYYFMQIGNGEVIDACRMGNVGRFMNHSCQPNCETQKWVVKGDLRVGFFALRTIQAGEELTFNYNFQTEKPIRCCCGSSNCNGTIGGGQKSDTEMLPLEEHNFDPMKDDVPDPIMLREDDVDEAMRAILARQVGLHEEISCSVDQIRACLRDLYLKHGLELLASSLDVENVAEPGQQAVPPRESSSGESSERPSSSRDGMSRSALRKRARGRVRSLLSGSLADRRGNRLGWMRPKGDTEKRRSEVDSSLVDITAASGKLYNPSRKNILKVLRLFNLIEIGMNEKERQEADLAKEKERETREELERSGQIYLGTASRSLTRQQPVYVAGYCVNELMMDEAPPTPRQRAQFADLSLLLDVVQHTIDPVARSLFIECGILSQVQQVIGRNFAPQYSVMLRKILRVVDCLPLQKSDFDKTRSAHGTMSNLITALTYHKDNGVRSIALSIARQHGLEAQATNRDRQQTFSGSLGERGPGLSDTLRSSRSNPSSTREDLSELRGGRGRLSCASAPLSSGDGGEAMSGAALPPPPPPPPPPFPQEKEREVGRSELSRHISLPPGFGCARSQSIRERELEFESQRIQKSESHDIRTKGSPDVASKKKTLDRDCDNDVEISERSSPREGQKTKRRREIQQRIIRKLHKTNCPSPDGLFSKELGKLDHFSEVSREEIRAKEARDLAEERQKRQRVMPLGDSSYGGGNELEGWDHLGRDFEDFVRQTLRQRLQKYQQPEHPLRLSAIEAEHHFRKLYASIMEIEETAFKDFARDGLRRHVSKVKLALNIKAFTSRTMHDYYESTRSHIKPEQTNTHS